MKKIAVLADSGCQFPIGSLEAEGIYIVPLTITMGEQSYLDLEEISAEEVFRRMERTNEMVLTSQPSTGSIQGTVRRIKDAGYEHIIGLPIATGLSSTLNGMKLACDMVGIPITLIDTKATACIQRYLIRVAKKLIDDGKSVAEIESILTLLVEDSGTLIMVPNLDHLKKGGRITPAVAILGNLLKIVPVMKLNYKLGGKIDTLGKVRTTRKACKILADRVVERGANAKDYTFAIEDVLVPEEAQRVRDYLEEQLGPCQVTMRELPSVVGAHMGIGGVGIQFIKNLAE